MDWLRNILAEQPGLTLFVCLGLGYAVGKVKFWKLSLGGVAGTLLVAIGVGMFSHATLSDDVKNIAFALFIFTLGYVSGPTFFGSLNRASLRYGVFTGIEVVAVLGITAGAIWLMGLDPGTAAGLMAGGATESAAVGTSIDAIAKLPGSEDEISSLQANVGTAYSISYICGLITVVIMSSQVFPLLMRVNLKAEAAKLLRRLGGGDSDADTRPALPDLVGRVHRVEAGAGDTVARLERRLGPATAVERIRRGDESVEVAPDVAVLGGDLVLLVGRRDELLEADRVVGPESAAHDGLDMDLDVAEVLVHAKGFRSASLEQVRKSVPAGQRHGVFLTKITRMDHALPVKPGTEIRDGDTVTLTGSKRDLRAAVPKVGFRIDRGVTADFVFISAGVALGFLVGMLVVKLGDVPLTLGTGGGCLLTGLLFGWLRAKRPTMGQYDSGAADVIKTLGLSVFIAAVGLGSGPQAVSLVEEFGVGLPIAGVLMTLIPASISMVVAWKVMKLPAPLALGAVTGQQCSTPGVTAVQQAAGNGTPLMSYTIVYALSNVVLPLLGPITVAMAHAIGGLSTDRCAGPRRSGGRRSGRDRQESTKGVSTKCSARNQVCSSPVRITSETNRSLVPSSPRS